MGYELYVKRIKGMRAELSEERVFSILQQQGPRNQLEIDQNVLEFERILRMCLFSIVHCIALVSIVLFTTYVLHVTDNYFIDFVGLFLYVTAISYSFYSSGTLQGRIFFREHHLLSVYRRISFLEAYPMYALLGLVLGGAVAVVLSRGIWGSFASYEKSQRIIALMFSSVNSFASFACILRSYFQEQNNILIVQDWVKKWQETVRKASNV